MKHRITTLLVATLIIAMGVPMTASAQAADQFEINQTVTTSGGDTTAPSVPSSLTAEAVSTSRIDLSWTASTDNVGVSGYEVFRDGLFIATSTATSYADTGLSAATTYTYTVRAFDSAGNFSAQSATATATTLSTTGGGGSAPIEIRDVVVTPDETSALITWETTQLTESRVSWGITPDYELGTLQEVGELREHSAKIENLVPATTYHFEIKVNGFDIWELGTFTTLPIVDVVPPPAITNFTATPREDAIDLSWINPDVSDFDHVRIVRSDKFFPEDPWGGKIIHEGTATAVTDTDVVPGVTYYYAAFAFDASGNYAAPAVTQARVGEDVVEEPFEEFPEAPEVPESIDALTLLDFDFFQQGFPVSFIGTAVPVDAEHPFTTQINYEKLPQVLKNIGVTLGHPDDPSKTFSFLLRTDRDNKEYAATVGALKEPGRYPLTITILDFQNQRLKKITGTLVVQGAQRESGDLIFPLLLLLILLLLLLLIALFKRRRKNNEEYIKNEAAHA